MNSTKIKMTVLSVIGAAAISMLSTAALAQDAPAPVAPADAAAAEYVAVTRCSWCHGPQGNSISPIYPALAGQKAWYILEQLQFFKAQTRADPYARGYMWGMAERHRLTPKRRLLAEVVGERRLGVRRCRSRTATSHAARACIPKASLPMGLRPARHAIRTMRAVMISFRGSRASMLRICSSSCAPSIPVHATRPS